MNEYWAFAFLLKFSQGLGLEIRLGENSLVGGWGVSGYKCAWVSVCLNISVPERVRQDDHEFKDSLSDIVC